MTAKGRPTNNRFISPFRYPGGKSWLFPRIEGWLTNNRIHVKTIIEPFAGGASIGLLALSRGYCQNLTLCELDERVAAVWRTILDKPNWLITKIERFNCTDDNVRAELSRQPDTISDLGFQTLLLNRVTHGGVISGQYGLLKFGEDGKGVRSRWYPDTLVERIKRISRVSSKISLVSGDGLELIRDRKLRNRRSIFWFIDPPYSVKNGHAGNRLYENRILDHEELFSCVRAIKGSVLMTYNHSPHITSLAKEYGLPRKGVGMKTTHHKLKRELLLGNVALEIK